MDGTLNYIRLPLAGAYNVRDLGGYAAQGNKVTRWHVFLRADALSSLTENDVSFLLSYGVTDVIDLRSSGEAGARPDAISGHPSISYHHVPFRSRTVVTDISSGTSLDMGNGYVALLKERETVCTLFSSLASAPGCALFHCTAGKDRTGILAMLLLGLAGVARQDIIANYISTSVYNSANPEYSHLPWSPGSAFSDSSYIDPLLEAYAMRLMYSLPEYINQPIKYIEETYGGSYSRYLLSCGIERATLGRILEKFI